MDGNWLNIELTGVTLHLLYFAIALGAMAVFIAIYTAITPYWEIRLIRQGTAAAAVSALTLSQWPSGSSASDGITGTTPPAQKSAISGASTRMTCPTRPRSMGPSLPDNINFSP